MTDQDPLNTNTGQVDYPTGIMSNKFSGSQGQVKMSVIDSEVKLQSSPMSSKIALKIVSKGQSQEALQTTLDINGEPRSKKVRNRYIGAKLDVESLNQSDEEKDMNVMATNSSAA